MITSDIHELVILNKIDMFPYLCIFPSFISIITLFQLGPQV